LIATVDRNTPRELLGHACLRGRFSSGAMPPWEFERNGEVVWVDPAGPLPDRAGGGTDLAVDPGSLIFQV
jgi:hypothetical protein